MMPSSTGEGESRRSGGGDQGWYGLERQDQEKGLGPEGACEG